MILERYADLPDFPFDRYFDSVNAYIQAQGYWHEVLRAAEGYAEDDWQPVEKALDLEDDMYTGLVVDIEAPGLRKRIKIHTASVLGTANFLLKEDQETDKLMRGRTHETDLGPALFDAYEADLAAGTRPALLLTQEAAERESQRQSAQTGGFQAGVDRRDFFVEALEADPNGPFVYGEELAIVASIAPTAETKALEALGLFLQPGPGLQRVNAVFVAD